MEYSELGFYEMLMQMGGLNFDIVWLIGVTSDMSRPSLCLPCDHSAI